MSALFLIIGVVLAGMIIASATQLRSFQLRMMAIAGALVVLGIFFTLASFRYVAEDAIGLVNKNIGWASLAPGKIIATDGEKGPQADILPPGWNRGYWPFLYDVAFTPIEVIPAGEVGVLIAADGQPLPRDTTYAPEWPEGKERDMLNAEYFLTEGGGYKGPQTSVLKPGSYRINPKLFRVNSVPVTTIEKATVGVVKSNVGDRPVLSKESEVDRPSGRLGRLVSKGQRGIWRDPLLPGQYYMNTEAYQITPISTKKQVVYYTDATVQKTGQHEESEIIVRTSDGFTFPVDVRVEYEIEPQNAPLLVATVGDDETGLRNVMNSAVRAIFRNNAENVKALNYVQQRSIQESQSLEMLQLEMTKLGVTVTGVRIGDVGDEETLGSLLKTQTDREIALQEQETFKEQQRAAEQKKELTRTEQEAEEEKRLATAAYAVKIAEQDKEKQIIAAGAEAEAVKIKAEAQANAYQQIAEQIGSGNAALIELLKIVGEENISITPRVMVVGQGGSSGKDGETTALIGTMLDTMMDKTPPNGEKIEAEE